MATRGREVDFARRLADPNKKNRDRAVKKLRDWLAFQSSKPPGLAEIDMMKVWKGLHYCMWLSDKRPVQEELADTLAKLIHSFPRSDQAFQFVKTFFLTMEREWRKIDKLRIDKYYMLVRFFVRESFNYLKTNKWNEGICESFGTVLADGPLSIEKQAECLGLCLHVTDIFLEELLSVADSQMTSDSLNVLFSPVYILAGNCRNLPVMKNIRKRIFEALLDSATPFDIDYTAIGESLFSVGADPLVRAPNRKILYELREKYVEKDRVVPIESPPKKARKDDDRVVSIDDEISVNFGRLEQLSAFSSDLEPIKLDFETLSEVDGKSKSKTRKVRFSTAEYRSRMALSKKQFVASMKEPGKSLLKSKKPGPLSPLEKRRRKIKARLNAKLD